MVLKNKIIKKKVAKKVKTSVPDLYKDLNTISFKLSLEKLNSFYSSKKTD